MGRFQSHGTSYGGADTRWADAGAALARGLQRRLQVEEAERKKIEAEQRELEKEMKLIEKKARENEKFAMIQNIGNIQFYDEDGPGRIKIGDQWVGPKEELAGPEDLLNIQKERNKNFREAQKWAADRYEIESLNNPVLFEGIDRDSWIQAQTRNYLINMGYSEIDLPSNLWSPQFKYDLVVNTAKPGQVPYLDANGNPQLKSKEEVKKLSRSGDFNPLIVNTDHLEGIDTGKDSGIQAWLSQNAGSVPKIADVATTALGAGSVAGTGLKAAGGALGQAGRTLTLKSLAGLAKTNPQLYNKTMANLFGKAVRANAAVVGTPVPSTTLLGAASKAFLPAAKGYAIGKGLGYAGDWFTQAAGLGDVAANWVQNTLNLGGGGGLGDIQNQLGPAAWQVLAENPDLRNRIAEQAMQGTLTDVYGNVRKMSDY